MVRIVGILVLIIAILLVSGYLYYGKTQERIQLLHDQKTALQLSNESNVNTIKRLNEEMIENEIKLRELNENIQNAEGNAEELREIFNDHNLTVLATEKPELIERRINDATQEVFDNIESDTRSE